MTDNNHDLRIVDEQSGELLFETNDNEIVEMLIARGFMSILEDFTQLNHFPNQIEKVIYNDPYTIVYFDDGDRIIVRTMEGDEFVPEVGLAMAICRKLFGSRAAYKRFVKKHAPKEKKRSDGVDGNGVKLLNTGVEDFLQGSAFRSAVNAGALSSIK